MTVRSLIAAGMLLGASPLFAVPVYAAVPTPTQQSGVLPHGGSYVIAPDPTIGAASVELWFRAPAAGYDNTTPGIARLAAVAAAAAPLASGKSLVALVHAAGGTLTINVYPDIVTVGAVVPSDSVRRVVAAMTAAYFAPTIDEASVDKSRRDAAVGSIAQRYMPSQTLHDALFARLFSAGPAHYAPLPTTVAQIAKIPSDQVIAFAKSAFRAPNANLTLAGNVDPASIDAVTDGGTGSADAPYTSTEAKSPESGDVSAAVEGVGLAWFGPAIADEKAATALDFIADYLFRDETGVISKALPSNKDSYVSGQFITLHDPGVMLVTIDGGDDKAAKQKVLDALAQLQQPMNPATFAAAREAFLYHLATDTQTPQQQADNLGWYAAEGNPGYAPGDQSGSYERNARALDPAYVAQIVRKYLSNPVVVTLQASSKESSS
jgi:predicted Zn-dependent peptidase